MCTVEVCGGVGVHVERRYITVNGGLVCEDYFSILTVHRMEYYNLTQNVV